MFFFTNIAPIFNEKFSPEDSRQLLSDTCCHNTILDCHALLANVFFFVFINNIYVIFVFDKFFPKYIFFVKYEIRVRK